MIGHGKCNKRGGGAWDVFRVLHRGINPEGGRGKGGRESDVFSES